MPTGDRVGSGHRVRFASDATRWLGIWLAASLNLKENRRRRHGKTREAEAMLRRMVNHYSVPLASARNLQAAIMQGTMLYASELTWNGKKGVEDQYQLAINRMARSKLGVYQSTPRSIVMAESGLTPARALLDHRRARFAQRFLARPQGGQGPEEIFKRESTLTARLRVEARVGREGRAEKQEWDVGRRFGGRIVVEKKDEALRTAKGWDKPNTVWTDGSRQESGAVRAARVYRSPEGG